MRVLFDHNSPFLLAHGGFQIQIEQTKAALEKLGIEVEFLKWWDDSQSADIIHYFGRPQAGYIPAVQSRGMKVIVAPLLTGLGSRRPILRRFQKFTIASGRRVLPKMLTRPFGWDVFQQADACLALTHWEGHLMTEIFGASPERVHVIPNGVEEVFLASSHTQRSQWLICTATIAPRKRVLELAHAAVLAQAPIWIIGKPYAHDSAYAERFTRFVSEHPKWIRYEGAINNRATLADAYRSARGFVLLSTEESLSLSALEAAACECPLLLSDLPWARTAFKENAVYCPVASPERTATVLKSFYDQAPSLKPPPRPLDWLAVGKQIRELYKRLLNTSR